MIKKIFLLIITFFVSQLAFSESLTDASLAYINSLPNQKAACIAKIENQYPADQAKQQNMLKRKEALSVCYQKIAIDVAKKFYPSEHFGKNLEHELNQIFNHQRHLYEKITHCPSSKNQECDFYEDYDALSAMVDYLNETVEFMVLNVGEGYPDFNPERWLKKWDNVAK